MPSRCLFAVGVIVATAASATAQPAGDADDASSPHDSVAARLAHDDAFTPMIVRAGGGPGGFAFAAATWDSVRNRGALDVAGELAVWGPIRIVARVDDATRESARPGAGVGVTLLDEARHGVASTAYLVYKAEGWTAPDGELEAQLAFAKSLGAVRTTFDVAYGQDPEGDDFDGEVALAAHIAPVPGVIVGVSGRYRDSLGSHAEETAMKRELIAGATSTFTHGRYAVSGLLGVAAVETASMPMTTGPAAIVSFGTAF